MRLLADENVSLPSVRLLREAGVDVASVSELRPGISDVDVLAWAAREMRITLTFDRDFGELVFRRGLSGLPGLIYCRFVPKSPTETGELLLSSWSEPGAGFEGHFTVIDRDYVRRRRLPHASDA